MESIKKAPCKKRTRKSCRSARKTCVYISSKNGNNYCRSKRGKTQKKGYIARKPTKKEIMMVVEFENRPESEKIDIFQPTFSPYLFDKPHSVEDIIAEGK
jgi:hypothetical protein